LFAATKSSASLLIYTQIEDKKRKHKVVLEFLVKTGLWEQVRTSLFDVTLINVIALVECHDTFKSIGVWREVARSCIVAKPSKHARRAKVVHGVDGQVH
jgi:hypothetical protein